MTKIRIPNIDHLPTSPQPAATVSLETIAYHEAGHALVSHYYHRKVYSAELKAANSNSADKPTNNNRTTNNRATNNSVRFEPNQYLKYLLQGKHDPSHYWPQALEQTLVTVRILLGGPVAQAFHQQIPFEKIDGSDDYRTIVKTLLLLERLRLNYSELHDADQSHRKPHVLDTLTSDVKYIINNRHHLPLLENVANALLEKNSLNTDEISVLLKPMRRSNHIQEIRRRLISRRQPPK